MHPDLNMVHFPSQGSLLMTRAQHSRSSWRQPAPWGTTTASPTPTLRLSSRATASMESKYLFLPLAKSSFLLRHKSTGADGLKKKSQNNLIPCCWYHQCSCCWSSKTTVTFPFLVYRGVILFRPPRLNNKFEDSTVKYSEDKYTNNKIKRFIQDNMWVLSWSMPQQPTSIYCS